MNMHAVREHQRIKRTLIEIEKNSLLERDPSLINLPIPIPSIPILGPILTGLVGGEADSTTAAAATTATATATATVTTTAPQTSTGSSSDSGSGENNGGSNGNGSGSGSEGGSSVNGGSGNSSIDAGSSPTVTVSSVASDSLDPSGTFAPQGSGSGSGSGTAVQSSSGISTVTSTDANGSVISGSGTSSASQTTNTIINVDAGAKPATQALVLGSSTSGSGAESTTASGSSGSTVSGKSTSTYTATSSVGSSSGGTSGSGTDSGTTLSSSATSHHGLSTTAIAGISAIIGVLLICLIIFFARRRYVARRSERRNRWWTAGSGSSVRTVTSSTRGSGDATVGSGTLTARSSFATNFDHGLTPSNPTFDFEYVSASLGLSPPPMAEVRGGAVSPSPSATLTVTRADLHRSNSAHSAQSDVSDSGAQYLTVHTEYNPNNLSPTGAGPPTPMSVRPFSPSESFAFPKPPRQSDDWTSIASRPQSLAARSHVSLTTPKTPKLPPLFPPALPSSNPFADPDAHLDLNDPFSDSDTAAAAATPEFAERETIRRPFVPTLQDELGVQPGDDIHIVEIFDDGWAFVEKFVGDTDTGTVQRGLIPIDCLRDADQSLPSFLADKRVSSSYGYGGLAV